MSCIRGIRLLIFTLLVSKSTLQSMQLSKIVTPPVLAVATKSLSVAEQIAASSVMQTTVGKCICRIFPWVLHWNGYVVSAMVAVAMTIKLLELRIQERNGDPLSLRKKIMLFGSAIFGASVFTALLSTILRDVGVAIGLDYPNIQMVFSGLRIAQRLLIIKIILGVLLNASSRIFQSLMSRCFTVDFDCRCVDDCESLDIYPWD